MNLAKWLPWSRKASGDLRYIEQEDLRQLYGGSLAKSGTRVSYTTAMRCATAMACARVIAEGIAQVPLNLLQQAPGSNNVVTLTDNKLQDILHAKVNEFQTSFEWREMVGLHLVFSGKHFSFINRVRGEIVELIPFLPDMVTTKFKGGVVTYTVRLEDGTNLPIPAQDMLHLKGPSWKGWEGLDGIDLAREAIGLALSTEEHGAKFFANGATIPGLITTDGSPTEEQRKALRESIEATHGSSERAWKIMLLWGGMKFQQMATANDSSQMNETRAFQVEEVCRAMRVMPIMVGHSDKTATYASSEQMFLAHVVHTMGPWYQRLEQAFNARLLTPEQRKQGIYTKFNVNGLLRGDAKTRAAYYTAMYNIRALNPNEIRSFEDQNPYDGGDEYHDPATRSDAPTPPADNAKPTV